MTSRYTREMFCLMEGRQVPFRVVSDIMGWSASAAVRMARRYGHIGQSARREAIDKLGSATVFDAEGATEVGTVAGG